GTCACTPPDVVCNGKCGPFPDGCPAATPTQDKIFRSFRRTLCGAYAPRGRRLMECIDTQRNLESCGGCLHPLHATFDQSSMKRQGSIGVDCTALEGVEDVRCSAGRCVVLTCESGWTVAPSGDHC
ncbi:uncharacterized protein FOMMEDRAFT_43207, partial [Fomitiporia mediterranea MF3/22]|uniref:uncharacterized protein n=1 Tax=Fomitiporia mediterranea (strain MF3/22) TaxID=694068 RepID=UPI0004407DE9